MEENNNEKAVKREEALIGEYKKLLIKFHENEEVLKKPDNEEINVYMEETEKLFPQIKSSKALIFDSKVLKKVGLIVKEKGQGMTANVINFQVEEYAQKMLQKMEVEPEGKTKRKSLVKLGKKVGGKFLRTPNLGYLYGALSSQPLERESVEKEVKARKPRVKEELKETNSQNVRKEDMKEEEEETAKKVERVFRALRDNYKMKGKQPLDFFQFIIDPESFSKTIQNMFHVSFLVKEGKAGIWVEKESGLPVIGPVGRRASEGKVVENQQVVMNITMRNWTLLAQKYKGQKPMIP